MSQITLQNSKRKDVLVIKNGNQSYGFFERDMDGKFCYYPPAVAVIDSDSLRQIADKLDELNNVHKGMEVLSIHKYNANNIENTFRQVANTLKSKDKGTCLDRDIMQCWQIIKNVISGNFKERVSRF